MSDTPSKSLRTNSGPSQRAEAPRWQGAPQVPVLVDTGLAAEHSERGWVGDAGDAERICKEAPNIPAAEPAWRRWGPLLAALACAGIFLGGVLGWEARTAYPAAWGDSGPNAVQVMTVSEIFSEMSIPKLALGPEIMEHKLRAPLHHLLAGAWLKIFGHEHMALVMFQTLLLLLAGFFVWDTVRWAARSQAAGLVAMALFYTAPETLIQAHCFFLEVSTVFWAAMALWALRPVLAGTRWGPAVLALALGFGLLSRHHSAIAIAIPVGLFSLPYLWRSLRRGPARLLALGLLFPLLGLLGSLASSWLTRDVMDFHDAPGSGMFSTNLTLLLLTTVAGVALLLWRPVGDDPDKERGLNLALAMGVGIGMALPWYLTFARYVGDHLGGSSAPELFSLGAAGRIIAFEYLCLALRLLSPLGLLLLLPGVVAALRRRHPITTLGLIGLAWANLTYPFFFHARYNFVLILFALPLMLAWIARRGPRVRRPIYAALLLLGLVRLAGWATPLPLSPLDPDEFRTESITWHEPTVEGLVRSIPQWATPLLTIGPMPGPDLLGSIMYAVEQRCDRPHCKLRIHEVPFKFQPYQVISDQEVYEYYKKLFRPSKAEWAERLPTNCTFHLLLVAPRAPTVSDALKVCPGVPITRQVVFPDFGNMQASLFEVRQVDGPDNHDDHDEHGDHGEHDDPPPPDEVRRRLPPEDGDSPR